jgi:hypothetical protein
MTKYISTDTGAQVDEAIKWIRDIFDGTDLANIGDLSMSGTLDLGTNTIYDGNMTGNWAMNGGNVSGMGTLGCGAITSSGNLSVSNVGTGGGVATFTDIDSAIGRIMLAGNTTTTGHVGVGANVNSFIIRAGNVDAYTFTNTLATFAGKLETTSTAVDSIKTAGGGSFGNAVSIGSANPWFYFNETDQSADNKIWLFNATGGNLFIGVKKDDTTGGTNALSLYRTGENITGVNFGNITSNPVFNFLGTGLVKASGKIETTSTASDSIKTAGGVESAGTVKVGAYTLPATDGTDGQVLVTNGAGVLTWTTL